MIASVLLEHQTKRKHGFPGFVISKQRNQVGLFKRGVTDALLLDLDLNDQTVVLALRRAGKYNREVQRMKLRSRHIFVAVFSMNALSKWECLEDYRFTNQHIATLSELIAFCVVTKPKQYTCKPLAALCIFLYLPSSTLRWSDIELKHRVFFCSFQSYFEKDPNCHWKFKSALELGGALLRQRAHLSAKVIEEYGTYFDNCVGFIYCTQIQMQRPIRTNSNQRCINSEHKRFLLIPCQTNTTSDVLLFAMYGLKEGIQHNLTFLKKSGWNNILKETLLIDSEYDCIFGDVA